MMAIHEGLGPANRPMISIIIFAERGERSSDQFRGDMKSASQVPKHHWFSRPGLPLQISVYQIPHDAGLTQIPYAAFQSFP